MIKKNLRGNNEVLKILDECGLDEETCSKSKRLKQMRDAIYYFYYLECTVEECCCNMDYISRRTFNNIKNKALYKIGQYEHNR